MDVVGGTDADAEVLLIMLFRGDLSFLVDFELECSLSLNEKDIRLADQRRFAVGTFDIKAILIDKTCSRWKPMN